MQYFLFLNRDYMMVSEGGAYDCAGVFDTMPDALTFAWENGMAWAHIAAVENGQLVIQLKYEEEMGLWSKPQPA